VKENEETNSKTSPRFGKTSPAPLPEAEGLEKNESMTPRKHIRLLILVTIAWFLFWIAGLPEYYQQYSTTVMVIFDVAILPPIWFLIYRSAKRSRPGRGVTVCLWWSFYISVPLFIYDLIYCALYLGHGASFLTTYWYLTVYYILPWILFPPTGWLIEKRRRSTQLWNR
jgi:hypothetical protein